MTVKIERIKERHCEVCFKGGKIFYLRVGNCLDTPIITTCICEDCYEELIGKMTGSQPKE